MCIRDRADNAHEVQAVQGLLVYPAHTLYEAVMHLTGAAPLLAQVQKSYDECLMERTVTCDLSSVRGQTGARRALEVAAAGGHNMLMVGVPGSGKTMLARCLPGILPQMTLEEAFETTRIHSVAGLLPPGAGLMTERPFRTPHHTTTVPALVGGGAKAKPGEVSLANYGVLFLDEMPEYSRRALETLRQPLEDRKVTVSRVQQTTEYPANFMLIASMNPCPCGNYGSKNQICRCTPAQIHNYVSKLSGPLMDRIDLQIEVDNISYDELRTKQSGESSAEIKKRINRVRALQRERFVNDGISTNAEMGSKELAKYCQIDENCERLLKKAFEKLNLSARGTTRILKVARTIADIEGCENILPAHIAEAIQYRGLDRKYS